MVRFNIPANVWQLRGALEVTGGNIESYLNDYLFLE